MMLVSHARRFPSQLLRNDYFRLTLPKVDTICRELFELDGTRNASVLIHSDIHVYLNFSESICIHLLSPTYRFF